MRGIYEIDHAIALVYPQDTNGDYIHHATFDDVAYCVHKFARPLAQGVLDPTISDPSESQIFLSFELPIFQSSKLIELIQFIELTARTRGQP